MNGDNLTQFDSFGIEYIPKGIKLIKQATKISQQILFIE